MTGHAEPAWRVGARAGWGAACGVLLAMAAARAFLPPDGPPTTIPEGLLPWTLHMVRLEPREKGFYALSLLLGSLCSLLAAGTHRVWQPKAGATFFLFFALCVAANEVARMTLTEGSSALPALAAAIAAACCWTVLTSRGPLPGASEAAALPRPSPAKSSWYVHAAVVAAILLAGFPASPARVAALIGFDAHPVSFMIGPALYFLGGDMLPGLDYYSQYSLGWGWIFHFLIADTAEHTVLRYAILTAVGTTLFHVGLYFLLNWFFRDWRIAAAICIAHLLLNFVTDRPFFAPSGTPLRYPLVPLVAFLLAWFLDRNAEGVPAAWRRRLLAATLGASVFLNTETGAYAAVAVALVLLIAGPDRLAAVRQIGLLAVESLAALMVLLAGAYGTGALTPGFLLAQLEPLLLFGVTGFGALPIEWKGFGWVLFPEFVAADMPCLRALGLCAAWGEWHLFYQIVTPGLALATLGYVWARVAAPNTDRARHAALAFHALIALLMSSKFVNMSIVALWHVNSLGFLVILGWWWKELLASSPSRWPCRLIAAAGVLLLVLLTFFSRDARNLSLYGWQAWERYPSLPRVLLGYPANAGCSALDCMSKRPSPRDVALITERTAAREPVAIFDLLDWTFHIATQRPPLPPFLPSSVVFTERQLAQYRERLLRSGYIFVSVDKLGFPFGRNTVFDGWVHAEDYVEEARGERLIALRRRTAGEAEQ